jgi:hypothetical protein
MKGKLNSLLQSHLGYATTKQLEHSLLYYVKDFTVGFSRRNNSINNPVDRNCTCVLNILD